MAVTIKFTDNNSTPTAITSGVDFTVSEYAPAVGVGDDPVLDSMIVTFYGGNSAVQAAIEKLQGLIAQAAYYDEYAVGYSVSVSVTIGSDTRTSKLRRGPEGYVAKLVTSDSRLKYEIANGEREVQILFYRDNYWQGVETDVLITGVNQIDTKTVRVYNFDDGTGTVPNQRSNYLEIAANQVLGDLPAPTNIKITSEFNSSIDVWNIYAYLNARFDPANFIPTREFTVTDNGSATEVSSGDASGGKYIQKSFSGSMMPDDTFSFFSTNSTDIARYKGGNFQLLANIFLGTAYTDLWVRGIIQGANIITYTTPWKLCSQTHLQEIFIAPIPPYVAGAMAKTSYPPSALVLNLQFKRTNYAAATVGVDFLQTLPMDGWRKLTPFGATGLKYQEILSDDLINGLCYKRGSSYGITAGYIPYGPGIYLLPNQLQRIYFQWDMAIGFHYMSSSKISLSYAPRWREL